MNQSWNANQYQNHAAFVAEHGLPILDLLQLKEGEKVLDLGCGDGTLSCEIEKRGGQVHGVDSSNSMIDSALGRGLSAEVMNGENLTFNNEFDVVFSNAALHWMTESTAVIKGVHQSLYDHGRFVGEFGGLGNIQALVNAMANVFSSHSGFGAFKSPWYFPDCKTYKAQLEACGFTVQYIELIPRPTPIKSGIREWLKIFTKGITSGLSEQQKSIFFAKVEEQVKPELFKNGQWVADYVRLRFLAYKGSKYR